MKQKIWNMLFFKDLIVLILSKYTQTKKDLYYVI